MNLNPNIIRIEKEEKEDHISHKCANCNAIMIKRMLNETSLEFKLDCKKCKNSNYYKVCGCRKEIFQSKNLSDI